MMMKYNEYVKQVFVEHLDCKGLDQQEIDTALEESSQLCMENYLYKIGYDLNTDYRFEIQSHLVPQKVFHVHKRIDDIFQISTKNKTFYAFQEVK